MSTAIGKAGGWNLDEARFQAFREAVTRLRWFMMITILLSSLIIFHVYLEKFGFQKEQLSGVYAYRIQSQSEDKRKCLKAIIASKTATPAPSECAPLPPEYVQKVGATRDRALAEYSRLEFLNTRTDNTLKKVRIDERELPLLAMNVPVNDYVPVIAILLVTFTVGVWLNLRAVLASLLELSKSEKPEILTLAQLHFTFTVPLDKHKPHPFVAVVAFLAVWLPFISVLFALVLDIWPVLEKVLSETDGFLGPHWSIILRLVLMFVCSFAILAAVMASSEVIKRVDTAMK